MAKINVYARSIHIKVDPGTLLENLLEAQKALNLQVMADCNKFVPHKSGNLRGSAYFPKGVYGDEIRWDKVYAHYQHEGLLYVSPTTGSAWAKRYEKKVLPQNPPKPFNYSQPGTGSHWFDKAHAAYGDRWDKIVKKKAGGG